MNQDGLENFGLGFCCRGCGITVMGDLTPERRCSACLARGLPYAGTTRNVEEIVQDLLITLDKIADRACERVRSKAEMATQIDEIARLAASAVARNRP